MNEHSSDSFSYSTNEVAMTTMPSYQTSDDLAFERDAKASARGQDGDLVNRKDTLVRAEGVYAQTLEQSRLLAAVCFFIAAALAVWAPGRLASLMVGLLGMAVVVSASSKWVAAFCAARTGQKPSEVETEM
jgi:hypothetical protein